MTARAFSTPAWRAAGLGAAVLIAGLFGGCPLPQPLPEAVPIDGGTITPPRIMAESAVPADTVVPVGTPDDCPDGTLFALGADLMDDNTDEDVDVRWFVDYQPDAAHSHILQSSRLQALSPPQQRRTVPQFVFSPNDYVGTVHVVEMVVSNGFYPIGEEPPGPLPNRTPRPSYETQVYRWTFQTVPKGRCK